ncbi:hypothetical protein [Chitinimonas sp.]|uniref:hypothetical protein n=1 Tax=Chitinimonas sp. TaxID=1934313 RepID=UPI0035B07964
MNRRQLMTASLAGAAGAALPAMAVGQTAKPGAGPVLLTISGAIGRSNRAALDPALDQLMAKQHVTFDKAFGFDFAALAAMRAVTIRPTLEYDGKPHRLRGPLLLDVLMQLGVGAQATVLLRALDGYAVKPTLADIARYRFIVATHLDDKPLPLGGLGPLWAVYDADRLDDFAGKPLNERFALCPWGVYHIEVQS